MNANCVRESMGAGFNCRGQQVQYATFCFQGSRFGKSTLIKSWSYSRPAKQNNEPDDSRIRGKASPGDRCRIKMMPIWGRSPARQHLNFQELKSQPHAKSRRSLAALPGKGFIFRCFGFFSLPFSFFFSTLPIDSARQHKLLRVISAAIVTFCSQWSAGLHG